MLYVLAVLPLNPVHELEIVQKELTHRMPAHRWTCQEIGTGNINFIYLAVGDGQKIIVKKDHDFARIDPEKFPLPIERLLYEYRAYVLYGKIIPEYLPEIYFFDLKEGMLAMEYLYPHTPLREGLIAGEKYPLLAKHLGRFLAHSLYFTSCYYLSQEEWKRNIALFSGNTAMGKIILDLNYTDPFYGSPLNCWTSPELDDLVADIQKDPKIKAIVNELKEKWLKTPEALSHGDLHTGSILVTPTDTRIIDPEFASYAPISFDIGMLLSNFAMASLTSDAHSTDPIWLAKTTCQIWDTFEKEFRSLWENQDVIPKHLNCAKALPVRRLQQEMILTHLAPFRTLQTPEPWHLPSVFGVNLEEKLSEIWIDTLRLMGIEIIRRIIGVAHIEDFELIAERNTKAALEKRALCFAKKLLLETQESFPDSQALESQLIQALGTK